MIKWEEQTLRSLLFAPGNHKHRLEKVGTFGADGIVLDLEDAVPESEKNDARELVLGALHTYNKTPVVCCLLYTSPSPRDGLLSRMPSWA